MRSRARRKPRIARFNTISVDRFGLPPPELAGFLEGVVPKIGQFAAMIHRDISRCPNFTAMLSVVMA